MILEISQTIEAISERSINYPHSDTYTHFGSGEPQSAQNLLLGWANKSSSLCSGLEEPVKLKWR